MTPIEQDMAIRAQALKRGYEATETPDVWIEEMCGRFSQLELTEKIAVSQMTRIVAWLGLLGRVLDDSATPMEERIDASREIMGHITAGRWLE